MGNTSSTFAIFIGIGHTRIAISKSCKDKYTYKGYEKNTEICAQQCFESSTVFVYGKNNKCSNSKGCKCWCINGATKEGKCVKPYAHYGYDTYRLDRK